MTAPFIVGLSGTHLTGTERAFLRAARPAGVILFARNVAEPDALRRLTGEAAEACGSPLVLVDQEGGRVQRIRPPLAPRYPSAAAIGAVHARDPAAGTRAAFLAGRLIAADLAALGITVSCLPVADVPVPGADDVIGDRAYAGEPERVATLARSAAVGVMAGGCLPVVKHMPGHGRATVDSHRACPVVDASRAALERDFAPFRALSDLPVAMTAHVRYTAIDPERPATVSPAAVEVIRAAIGFDGLLLTDDISMGALSGSAADNAAAALAAGCDMVLHCTGRIGEMEALAAGLPPLTVAAQRRLDAAVAALGAPDGANITAMRAEFDALTRGAAAPVEGRA
jgi:beta-N-acetylhexosaminidase